MKIRNGFVSNSSSSSFILGLAKIDDYNKFQNYINQNDIKLNYQITVKTYEEIKEHICYNAKIINNKIFVESFQTDICLSNDNINDNDLIFIVNITNNEGDNCFMSEYDYIDYDIDLSFFDNDQQKIYKMFFDDLSGLNLNKSEVTYGAGRNG